MVVFQIVSFYFAAFLSQLLSLYKLKVNISIIRKTDSFMIFE